MYSQCSLIIKYWIGTCYLQIVRSAQYQEPNRADLNVLQYNILAPGVTKEYIFFLTLMFTHVFHMPFSLWHLYMLQQQN